MVIPSHRDSATARGFSLLELLATLAVVTILTGLLFPAFGQARELARRLMCQNNLRVQFTALVESTATGAKGDAPQSRFGNEGRPQQMSSLVYRPEPGSIDTLAAWDGLGELWRRRLVHEPRTFYCPAHQTEHSYENHADAFLGPRASLPLGPDGQPRDVQGNYHFWMRWLEKQAETRVSRRTSSDNLWVTDGISTRPALNHGNRGCNGVFEDGNIRWIGDKAVNDQLASLPHEIVSRQEQVQRFSDLVTALQGPSK